MVSFQCDGCGDTIKKPQLDKHRNRCWSTFSCIDCSTTFHGTDYKAHTSCISEAEKYQGALYKGKKGGHAGNNAPAKSTDQNGRYQPYPTSKPKPQDVTPEEPTPAATTTAEPTPEPTASAPPAPTIHPSRTALLNGTHDPTFRPRPARSAFPNLHPGASYPPPKPFGRNAQRQQQMASTKNYATGMNGMGGGEMRSWGGSPEVEASAAAGAGDASETTAPVVLSTEKITVGVPYDDGSEKKKKNKKRKGDKGGTGSRANSNAAKKAEEAAAAAAAAAPVSEVKPATSGPAVESGDAVKATAEAPAVIIPATPLASESQHTRASSGDSKKKRKAEAETDVDASSSKTAKKLRKALNSIAASKKSAAGSVPLASLIEQLSEQVSKKKKSDGVIDATAITQDIKVKFVQADDAAGEGQWVLEV